MQNKRIPRVFFDMDGVLNVWEANTHMDIVAAPGYMRTRKPIESMVKASELLSKAGFEVWIASAVLPYEHSIPDKKFWIREHCPWFTEDRQVFIPYGTDKAKSLRNLVDHGDVFLDDYTANLRDLQNTFGKQMECVKVLNGINDTNHSWKGKRISIYSDAQHIAESIADMSARKEVAGIEIGKAMPKNMVDVHTNGGHLIARSTGESEYPAISVLYQAENDSDCVYELFVVENPEDGKDVNMYVFANPNSGVFSQKITVSTEGIEKSPYYIPELDVNPELDINPFE